MKTTLAASVNTTFTAAWKDALVTCGWTAAVEGTGWKCTSATTPYGLSMYATATNSGANVAIASFGANGTFLRSALIGISGGRVYDFVANKYTAWLSLAGVIDSGLSLGFTGNSCVFGVPYLPEPVAPLIISGATNATPIVITTTAAHGLTSGESVYIQGVGGNTAANGTFIITSLTTTTFSLNSSVGNGAYTSGGYVGGDSRISRYVFCNDNYGSDAYVTNGWRYNPFGTGTDNGLNSQSGVIVNSNAFAAFATFPIFLAASSTPWRGTRSSIVEPYLYGPESTYTGSKLIQAQLYNACIVTGSPTPSIDALFTMDGHDWMVHGASGTSVLAVAYT